MSSAYEIVASTTDGKVVEARAGDRSLTLALSEASGGPGNTLSPKEAVLAALGSCTAMTLHLYAANKGWDLGPVSVRVRIEEGGKDEPTKIEQIVQLEGDLDDAQRERLEAIAGRCPVHKLLDGPKAFEDRLGSVEVEA